MIINQIIRLKLITSVTGGMDAAQLGCGIRTYRQPDKGFLLLFILEK